MPCTTDCTEALLEDRGQQPAHRAAASSSAGSIPGICDSQKSGSIPMVVSPSEPLARSTGPGPCARVLMNRCAERLPEAPATEVGTYH